MSQVSPKSVKTAGPQKRQVGLKKGNFSVLRKIPNIVTQSLVLLPGLFTQCLAWNKGGLLQSQKFAFGPQEKKRNFVQNHHVLSHNWHFRHSIVMETPHLCSRIIS